MAHGIPEVNFGRGPSFKLGVEEEFVLVDPATGAVSHSGSELLPRLPLESVHGRFAPDTYEAEIELKSPISEDGAEAAMHLGHLRAALREAGATAIGSGLHPNAVFGDVEHVPGERYAAIVAMLRGLITRTPTAALHVHVGMPDPATAILAYNGLRRHLPLLQALSANSPFWFGKDSGFDSARAQLFRAYPRATIPRAFRGFPDYEKSIEAVVASAEIADYTFLWWDVRPHPLLGTVEVRAMDAQSNLEHVAGLAALVHGLALHEVANPSPAVDSGILMESSFRAARDGLRATIWFDGALAPVAEVAERAVRIAKRHVDSPALEEVGRILTDGNGADRQRAVHARAGMDGLIRFLAEKTLGQA
ncbi:MAG TPA: YbdK family carboxylate-amine ligase [Solirubrobacteraceae bacterium]|jgi:carboxylate-amine ligase